MKESCELKKNLMTKGTQAVGTEQPTELNETHGGVKRHSSS